MQSETVQLVDFVLVVAEVHYRRRARVLQFIEVYVAEHGVVLQEESVTQHALAVADAKRPTGLFVDVAQHAVLVVENHVYQGGIEHRMIAHQQRVDIFLAPCLVGDVALDA